MPIRRLAEAARLGASERARPRPRSFFGHRTLRADFCHRRETRAHPRGDRHPARSVAARVALAPDAGALQAASMATPHPPAAPSPEARAWLHGGPERSRHGHPRRERGGQRVLEHRCSPSPPRPPLLVRANVRAEGEAGVPSSREETAHRWCRMPRPDERDDAFFIRPSAAFDEASPRANDAVRQPGWLSTSPDVARRGIPATFSRNVSLARDRKSVV